MKFNYLLSTHTEAPFSLTQTRPSWEINSFEPSEHCILPSTPQSPSYTWDAQKKDKQATERDHDKPIYQRSSRLAGATRGWGAGAPCWAWRVWERSLNERK